MDLPSTDPHIRRSQKIIMRNVDIIVPDLFLPQEVALDACVGLTVPALEMVLARSSCASSDDDSASTLEGWLCQSFGIKSHLDEPIAPITLAGEGVQPGSSFWLRADPVHLEMRHTQFLLRPEVQLSADEATQLCASLNEHFVDEDLHFIAPHPQRWYIKTERAPGMRTHSLDEVTGRNAHAYLPTGQDAMRWHKVCSEIQIIFFDHPVSQAREARGELPINSLWLWGGGHATDQLTRPYTMIYGDDFMTQAFARVADVPYVSLSDGSASYGVDRDDLGDQLIVWGDLRRAFRQGDINAWRDSVQHLERDCIAPLWKGLRDKRVERLTLIVLGAGIAQKFILTRGATWKLWRSTQPLTEYALI